MCSSDLADWFEDTPDLVQELKELGLPMYARHLHRMHVYHKSLLSEIRKLRRQRKEALINMNKAAEDNGEPL